MPYKNPEDAKANRLKYQEEHKEELKKRNQEYYQANKEKIKQASKKWVEKNKERRKEIALNFYYNHHEENKKIARDIKKIERETNKEGINAYQREWRNKNIEHCNQYKREWHKENLDKIKEYRIATKEKNPERYKELLKASRIRRRSKPFGVFEHSIRTRLAKALNGETKKTNLTELLGCSIHELKAYLESKFQPGMTWENRGFYGWHIDHVIPCSKFDFSKLEDQKACFHYTNLQPLWAIDNLVKGSK